MPDRALLTGAALARYTRLCGDGFNQLPWQGDALRSTFARQHKFFPTLKVGAYIISLLVFSLKLESLTKGQA